ncbi:DUF1156 domain-containing protein [Halorussus caseinilyticus]|uniref:DUF1156 domain-containing protein n=1 Tax=Halorussus caseinilyticus TaxID=3034025 RepID=A0ABD5WME3_9EURY|nr:DUF1156 domain-containing protein [Halorussus sp. DT72]
MAQESGRSADDERNTLPIERGFPIERVNEIAAKEGRAKIHYRPIATMHKWWARRLGCVFRTICLYALVDDPETVSVREPGRNASLDSFVGGTSDVQRLVESVDLSDPESLWELYPKDVQVEGKKILDPFMGGGTSLVEASRFGVESVGYDLNPVAWLVTKKQLEAGRTDLGELDAAFESVEDDVREEITRYYRTPCPNAEREDPRADDDPAADDLLGLDADFEYEIGDDARDELAAHDHHAEVMYEFWVKELDCVSCGTTVPLFKDYRVASGRYEDDGRYNVFCPACESVVVVDDWQSESTCSECGHEWVPERGTVSRGREYTCTDCGQRYAITDAIREQGGFDLRQYAVEYYCETCDDRGLDRSEVKGYKSVGAFDEALYDAAEQAWEERDELREYVPDEAIPEGHLTAERNPIFDHGYHDWTDMFNARQLLCLSSLLRSIDRIEDRNLRELLLLTFSDSLMFQSTFTIYNLAANKIEGTFRLNSFVPQVEIVENNVWGTRAGRGTFSNTYEKVRRAVEYAANPTERYVSDGETVETPPFAKPIGDDASVYQGDMRTIDAEDEYDAVITDPPYYDNLMYSEVSDYFYVWQKLLLEDEYDWFEYDKTPRAESIVTNPFLDKTTEDFESELHEAFTVIHRALKDDGVLAFTYHHSDSESWGELLAALCDVGFEVTATAPVSADSNKFISGEAVEFDIVIVARPADEREPISWNSLRRRIYRTAEETRERLETDRNLAQGDIGVVEMGRCFHEYSKHHGEVRRAGDIMTAKEVVEEIYGVVQHGSDIGEIDLFLDLLEVPDPTFDDLNKLARGTDATPEQLEDARLYRTEDGDFRLGTWDDDKRIAYLRDRVESDRDGDGADLTDLDKAQFLRYRWEHDKSLAEYVDRWSVTDDLRALCEGLADATGDDAYRKLLEARLGEFE